MTALVAKKYWDKLKVWCYYHWKWLVLILAFLVALLFSKRGNKKLLEQAQGALDSQKLENAAVERSHRLEIKKREKARKKYESAIEKIEKQHSEGQQKLDKARKKELKKNLKLAKNNPDEIDKILSEEFGLKEIK